MATVTDLSPTCRAEKGDMSAPQLGEEVVLGLKIDREGNAVFGRLHYCIALRALMGNQPAYPLSAALDEIFLRYSGDGEGFPPMGGGETTLMIRIDNSGATCCEIDSCEALETLTIGEERRSLNVVLEEILFKFGQEHTE